jgi:ribonuclease HI
MKHVILATDGAYSRKRGMGGWCAILQCDDHEKVLFGRVADASNNQMELMAILRGLESLNQPCVVEIVTDSMLAVGWLSLGWRRKNSGCAHIAAQIDRARAGHNITFTHVRGHQGHKLNERCDEIAREQTELS